jgi:hypothetical protein
MTCFKFQIPNPKSQVSSKFQIQISKNQENLPSPCGRKDTEKLRIKKKTFQPNKGGLFGKL